MAALVFMRLVTGGLRLLPAPVHRALDGWSQRRAAKRRERRLRIVRAHAK